MSGGSYDYLGDRARNYDLIHVPYYLTGMRDRLARIPEAAKALADTQKVIDHLNTAAEQAARLADVWHAIEWWHSGDWGEDQAMQALARYRGEEEQP